MIPGTAWITLGLLLLTLSAKWFSQKLPDPVMRLPLCFQSIQVSFDWEECKLRGQWDPGTSCSLLSHNSLKIVHSYLFTVVQSVHEHTKVFVFPCSSHGCTACRRAVFWQKAPYWFGKRLETENGTWHIHRHMSGSNAWLWAVCSLTWWTWIDGALRMWTIPIDWC